MSQTGRTSWKRFAVVLLSALCAGAIGMQFGERFGYALANAVDRDIAELKGTLIWFILLTPPTSAMVGAAAAMVALRSRWRRAAVISAASFVAAAGLFLTIGYEWPKSAGMPVIEYELLLPDGLKLTGQNQIDLTIWNGKSGHGCYIKEMRQQGSRQLVAGSIVLHLDNHSPTMSIVLGDGEKWFSAGVWELPYRPEDQLEVSFRPWRRIEFVRNVHDKPLPTGNFQIRYRLRSFM